MLIPIVDMEGSIARFLCFLDLLRGLQNHQPFLQHGQQGLADPAGRRIFGDAIMFAKWHSIEMLHLQPAIKCVYFQIK